ncbi:MAG: 2OG-Fe(II) oxygenase [Chitinophagaceae bacterium]|nr:MAG: 2OG-Fe(II) oxygenase [Chitinophagaceae bacterium]
MEKIFNDLVSSFIENKIGIAENFLSKPIAFHLKENLISLHGDKLMEQAGTGSKDDLRHNDLVRSDIIYWLDRKHDNVHENNFFDLMDAFIIYLNETCYTGITSYEFHYTLYEKGSFYKKHIDQFQGNDSRKYSMIMYLNDEWEVGHGGELRIHLDDGHQDISPVNGKSVFFKSNELTHEVLISNKPRMSITGWLKS